MQKRSLVAAALAASFLTIGCGNNLTEPTPPTAFEQADLVRGGALYDKWWIVAGVSEPDGDHPLWSQRPDQTSNNRSGGVTFRCKECHGWDYKGVDGVYSAGSHRTGFPGIIGTAKSPQEIFDLLKNHHEYGSLGLSDGDLWDMTKFVLEGLIDTDSIIDQEGKFISDSGSGPSIYDESCTSCHGADGLTKPSDAIPDQPGASPDYDEFPQVIANENPWEFQHKILFGQPGTDMPLLARDGITLEELASLGAFVQSLDMPEEDGQD